MAGAMAGVAGEGSAMLLAEKVFNKAPSELNDEERALLKTASQLAGAVLGNISGGNTASTIGGMATAKSAVENNFLSVLSQNKQDKLEKKIKEGKASRKEIIEYLSYDRDDHTSDYLADKARNHPEKMTDEEWKQLGGYIQRYVSESLRNGETADTINQSVKDIVSGNYMKGYGYAYALDEKYRSNLPSRWFGVGSEQSEKEKFYYDLKYKYVQNPRTIENSFDGKIAKSTKEGLETVSTISGAAGVIKGTQAINSVMSNSTKFTLGIAGAGSVAGQYISDGNVNSKTLAIDLVTAYALKGKGISATIGGNAASGVFNAYVTDNSITQGAINSGIGSAIGYGVGKAVEIPLAKRYPDLTWSKYNSQSLSEAIPYVETYRYNITPAILGGGIGEFFNRSAQYHYNEQQKGNKE